MAQRRSTQKTHDGIETVVHTTTLGGTRQVEALRKPTTGLKHSDVAADGGEVDGVEALRKPTTGLKRCYVLIDTRHARRSKHSENPRRD